MSLRISYSILFSSCNSQVRIWRCLSPHPWASCTNNSCNINMHSACISLQSQTNIKSKELCVSLTCRAECKNMTFCTSTLCPNFLFAVPSPQHQPPHQHVLLLPAGLLHSRSASEGVIAPSFHSAAVFDCLMGRKRRQSHNLPRDIQ